MGFPRATALLVIALLAAACGSAFASILDGLSLLSVLPLNCGSVLQVQQSDTCQSLAEYGGISPAKYAQLNPLALCNILLPAPGALTCIGDKSSFGSGFYHTVAGDTCDSITSTRGAVLGVGTGVTCASLVPNTPVCVRPTANLCDVNTLCDVPLSADMRDLLGLVPDWCTILSKCQAPMSATTMNGLPAVLVTLSDITPTISQVAGNPGHPELRDFVAQHAAGPVQLQVAFAPNAGGDGKHAVSFAFTSGSNARKLLATKVARTGTYHPTIY